MHLPRLVTGILALALCSEALAADDAPPGKVDFNKKGFVLADASGKNALGLSVRLQPRFIFTDTPGATDADRFDNTGFRIRRALLIADGQLYGAFKYRFRIDAAKIMTITDGNDATQTVGRPFLDDAQLTWKIADPFQIVAGQYKAPYTSQESMVGDTNIAFPERSLANDGLKVGDIKAAGFTLQRDIGVDIQGDVADKKLDYQVGVFGGEGANVWPPLDTGNLFVARVAVAPLGEFKYEEIDLDHKGPRLGLAIAANQNRRPTFKDDGAKSGTDTDTRLGGELRFAASGFQFNSEVFYGTVASGDASTNHMGFYAQATYAAGIVAPGVRYSRLDPDLGGTGDALQSIDGVVNVFFPGDDGKPIGQLAKLQLGWSTVLAEGADQPVYHQGTLAAVLGF